MATVSKNVPLHLNDVMMRAEHGLVALTRQISQENIGSNCGPVNEDNVNDLLRSVLPQSWQVLRGLLIDQYGNRSEEMDTIIVREDIRIPLSGSFHVVPIESAIAVFSIKTNTKDHNSSISQIHKTMLLDTLNSNARPLFGEICFGEAPGTYGAPQDVAYLPGLDLVSVLGRGTYLSPTMAKVMYELYTLDKGGETQNIELARFVSTRAVSSLFVLISAITQWEETVPRFKFAVSYLVPVQRGKPTEHNYRAARIMLLLFSIYCYTQDSSYVSKLNYLESHLSHNLALIRLTVNGRISAVLDRPVTQPFPAIIQNRTAKALKNSFHEKLCEEILSLDSEVPSDVRLALAEYGLQELQKLSHGEDLSSFAKLSFLVGFLELARLSE